MTSILPGTEVIARGMRWIVVHTEDMVPQLDLGGVGC